MPHGELQLHKDRLRYDRVYTMLLVGVRYMYAKQCFTKYEKDKNTHLHLAKLGVGVFDVLWIVSGDDNPGAEFCNRCMSNYN